MCIEVSKPVNGSSEIPDSSQPPRTECYTGTTKENSNIETPNSDPTENDTIGGNNDENVKGKERTRSTMALLFALGFFALLFLCFAYAIKAGSTLNELKEALVAIIGSLSGILGFIVGYYYKSSQEP